MKREYFGMLFLVLSVVLILLTQYFFGEAEVMDKLSKFIVI